MVSYTFSISNEYDNRIKQNKKNMKDIKYEMEIKKIKIKWKWIWTLKTETFFRFYDYVHVLLSLSLTQLKRKLFISFGCCFLCSSRER